MGEENKTRDVIDAITGVAKAIPIYEDAFQPATREIGKALHTVAQTVHIALAPVSALVWGYKQFEEFVSTKVADRLKHIPPENIISPKPNVAGPALEALRYTGHEEALSDMYANLLSAAMDKSTAEGAHPAFVEIIKQLTPDEAKLINLFLTPRAYPILDVMARFDTQKTGKQGGYVVLRGYSNIGAIAGCEYAHLLPSYLDNICRLGLVDLAQKYYYTTPGLYEALEESDEIRKVIENINSTEGIRHEFVRYGMHVTNLGEQFAKICAAPKSTTIYTAGELTSD